MGRASVGPAQVSGLGPARPKKLKKKIFWADVGPPILD